MSFDQYFENAEPEWLSKTNDNDWYGIVQEALHAANLQSRRQRGQLELNLMKPLPIIPEDAVGDSPRMASVDVTVRRPSSVYSSEADFAHWPNPHEAELQVCEAQKDPAVHNANECDIARRPSSVYSTDFDLPESPESNALNYWASDICVVGDSSMGSLREKASERLSKDVGSSSSDWSTSAASSDLGEKSRSSSMYSIDSSACSYTSYAKSKIAHTRNISESSTASSKKVRFEETALVSFFDFSDDDEDEDESDARSGVRSMTRPKSHAASKCLKAGRQLGKKAFSLRITTSPRTAQSHPKASSMPSSDVPAFSAWLFRSSLLDRVSSSPTGSGTGLEGQLMAGAAESAKARRLLGLK